MPERHPERILRIGLVGHGFMGRAHSLAWRVADQVYDGIPKPVLAALAGQRADRAENAAAQLGFESGVADWRVLIDRADIDVIDICTPVDSHAEIATAALAAGKHVLCEKPLSRTAAEAELLVASAAEAHRGGVVVMVGFNYRRLPAIALARQLVQGGSIGTLRHVRARYLQDWLSGNEGAWTWRLDAARAGAGALGDIASHLVDLTAHVTGTRLGSVTGTLDTFVSSRSAGSQDGLRPVTVDDACAFLGRSADGLAAVFEASRCAPGRKNQLSLELNGSDGSIFFDLERLNELGFYSGADKPAESGFRTVLVTEPAHPYLDAWWPPGHTLGWDHSFVHQARDFLVAAAAGQPAAPDFADGLYVQNVIEAVALSARTGAWQQVPGVVGADANGGSGPTGQRQPADGQLCLDGTAAGGAGRGGKRLEEKA
jgi:predicted dehydrogenase